MSETKMEAKSLAETVETIKPLVMAYLRAEAWLRVAYERDREPSVDEYRERDDAAVLVAEYVPDLLRALGRDQNVRS